MVMNIIERRREIGITRSQGMSKSQVILSTLSEAAILGVVGFAMGVVAGLLIHKVLISYMSITGFQMPYIILYDVIGFSLILALLASIFGALYPAYHASKLNIADTLRH